MTIWFVCGYIEDNKIYFYNKVDYNLCSQVRVFNEKAELRIVKLDNRFFTKIIKDEDYADKLEDENMFISGNKIIDNNNKKFTVIEQIGRKIAIPMKLSEEDVKKGVRLIVRNYCDVDENGQVVIAESRLVELVISQ